MNSLEIKSNARPCDSQAQAVSPKEDGFIEIINCVINQSNNRTFRPLINPTRSSLMMSPITFDSLRDKHLAKKCNQC